MNDGNTCMVVRSEGWELFVENFRASVFEMVEAEIEDEDALLSHADAHHLLMGITEVVDNEVMAMDRRELSNLIMTACNLVFKKMSFGV